MEIQEEEIKSFEDIFSKPGGRKKSCPGNLRRDGVPPYPGPSIVEVAKVPAPPKLDPESPINESIKYVAKTYMKAADAYFLKTSRINCGIFFGVLKQMKSAEKSDKAKQKLYRMKYYNLLKGAAEFFIKKNIAPAAWITYSIDSYNKYEALSGDVDHPRLAMYVLNAKSFGVRRHIFKAEAGRYSGGKLLYSKSHRELFRRYQAMQDELLWCAEATQIDIYKIIDKHFPLDTYDQLVSKANKHARKLQDSLRDMARRGEWLWSDSIWQGY